MQTLFVYYKIPVAEHSGLLQRLRVYEKRVHAAWPGLQIEWMQRPEESAEGMETWMEVYRHPQGISAEMTASITQLASLCGLPPKRASEFFIPLRE